MMRAVVAETGREVQGRARRASMVGLSVGDWRMSDYYEVSSGLETAD